MVRRIYLLDKNFVTSHFCPLVVGWPFLQVDDQVEVETCFFSREKIQGDVRAVVVVQNWWCTKWTQKPRCHYYFIHSHIKLQTCTHTTLVLIYSKIAHTYYFFIFLFILIVSLLVHTTTHYTAHPKIPKGDLKCTTTQGIPNTLKNLANIQIRLTTSKMEN